MKMDRITMKQKILVVDDDKEVRDLLTEYLQRNKFDVVTATNAAEFEVLFAHYKDNDTEQLSLIILDVMLPDVDGFELCKRIRNESQVPVFMVTACSDDTDRIIGLELGADDYIAKPFNPRELLARIRAVHRRMNHVSQPKLQSIRAYKFREYYLDVVERTLVKNGNELINLSGTDFQLLQYFVENSGAILDRGKLSENTRGRDTGPMDRYLDVQISRLRARICETGSNAALIKTVRGAGYVFSAEVNTVYS
jgi:two-component system, OmpR family, response regulator